MPGWTRGHFRRLFPWDADHYAAHLKALSPDGRRRRFCGMVNDDVLDAHAVRAIETGHVEGCFLDGGLIGAFELFVDPQCGHAQVALSVDPEHDGDGLGTELMVRARSRASLLGATGIELQIQGDNAAMIAVARGAGAPMCRNGTELEATLTVPRRDLVRLPFALAQDEARLLRGMFWSLLAATRRAAAQAMDDPARFRFPGWHGGFASLALWPGSA